MIFLSTTGKHNGCLQDSKLRCYITSLYCVQSLTSVCNIMVAVIVNGLKLMISFYANTQVYRIAVLVFTHFNNFLL